MTDAAIMCGRGKKFATGAWNQDLTRHEMMIDGSLVRSARGSRR